MNIRIAILATFASTLTMAQVDTAKANYSDTVATKVFAKAAGIRPEQTIVLAQSTINTSRSNIKHPSKKAGSNEANTAMGDVLTTRGRVQKGSGNGGIPVTQSGSENGNRPITQSGSGNTRK